MTNTERKKFTVPTRDQVSQNNQLIFDSLQKNLGFIPNLYAYFGKSETALADYLALQNRKSSLTLKEREVINLVTSQINDCRYCQSAHTALGKMVGFTEEQILDIRKGDIDFNAKLNALAMLTAEVVRNKGRVAEATKEIFFDAGYSEVNLIDAVIIIGDKIISNYLHALTNLEIDFPVASQI